MDVGTRRFCPLRPSDFQQRDSDVPTNKQLLKFKSQHSVSARRERSLPHPWTPCGRAICGGQDLNSEPPAPEKCVLSERAKELTQRSPSVTPGAAPHRHRTGGTTRGLRAPCCSLFSEGLFLRPCKRGDSEAPVGTAAATPGRPAPTEQLRTGASSHTSSIIKLWFGFGGAGLCIR